MALAFPVVFILVAILGLVLQTSVFRRMEGEELRQTLVTHRPVDRARRPHALDLGRAVLHDPVARMAVGPDDAARHHRRSTTTGEVSYLQAIPPCASAILVAAIVIGVAMWLVLNRTAARHADPRGRRRPRDAGRLGRAHPATCSSPSSPSARDSPVWRGIVGGTFQSLSPGEDTRFLLASLVVVIVGGMGSIPGAAHRRADHRASPSRWASSTRRPIRSSSPS